MGKVSYQRPARVYPEPLPEQPVVLVTPPPVPALPKGSGLWVSLLFPVVGSLGSLIFVFMMHNWLWAIATGSFAVLTVIVGLLMWWQQRRSVRIQLETNRDKYYGYLRILEDRLHQLSVRHSDHYGILYPDMTGLAKLANDRHRIWERRRDDGDFLHVSVGRGALPLCCPVGMETAHNPLLSVDDDLLQAARDLITRYQAVPDCPYVVSLVDNPSIAVAGDRVAARGMVRAMLAQVGVFYSPTDVQVVVCCSNKNKRDWSWIRWLPHARKTSGVDLGKSDSLCYLFDEVDGLQAFMAEQVEPRLKQQRRSSDSSESARAFEHPHLILVIDGVDPLAVLASVPDLLDVVSGGRDAGVTLVYISDAVQRAPAWVKARLDFDAAGNLRYEELRFNGRRVESIHPEQVSVSDAEAIARCLTPLRLDDRSTAANLAESFSLQALLGENGLDVDDVHSLWRDRSLEDTLRVPIGRQLDGRPLVLDLKEAADGGMGPHGMIVGATGSGKSELLRTIVTSLASQHHPELLNFVLIDFKGGAAFAELAELLHNAGLVTNLEGDIALVDRIHAALFGELERRQRLLREAGNLDNIKQYQARKKANPALEPLPYLLVVVDEFGELLTSRPDFQELFAAIGRIGRSIGMHLLLATQRFDEGRVKGLESHLRYRICMRTFSPEESTSVLGSPEAFYLPPYPGVGCFKVDTSLLEVFKTASVSQPYQAGDVAADANTIYAFTEDGSLIPLGSQPGDSARSADSAVATSDLTELQHFVAQALQQGAKRAHQVWLPPLPAHLSLQAVFRDAHCDMTRAGRWPAKPPFGWLTVPLGQVDLPAEQRMEPLLHSFSGAEGHLAIVGAPQSGKSTLLRTLLISFIATHRPTDVQFYLIDFGGGLLRVFEHAPHTGTLCGKADRELIPNVIRHIRTLIEEREMMFRNLGIDSMATYRLLRQQGQLADEAYGDVFLVVDDFGQLWTEFDAIEQELVDIVASGLNYGVHVIATANRWVDIRPKVIDNIGGRLELRLNDAGDSEIGRSAQLALVSAPPGRGLTRHGRHFQAALPILSEAKGGDQHIKETLAAFLRDVQSDWHGPSAPGVRLLPLLLPADALPDAANAVKGIPFGVESTKLDPVFLDFDVGDPHLIILGDTESGKTNVLRHIVSQLSKCYTPEEAELVVIDYRRMLLEDVAGLPHLTAYVGGANMVGECVNYLVDTLTKRLPTSVDMSLKAIRTERTWSGPRCYLLVDDYDWVSSQGLSPLAPLVDLLLQARDIGFHVILTRRLGGVSGAMYESVFKRLREMGVPLFVMNGDAQEARLLGCPNVAALPHGRGYLQRRNAKTAFIQTPLCGLAKQAQTTNSIIS